MLAKSVRKYIRVTDDFDYLRPGQQERQQEAGGGRRRQGGRRGHEGGYSEAATATAAAAAGNHFRSQLATFCGHVERCASVCVCATCVHCLCVCVFAIMYNLNVNNLPQCGAKA